MADRIRSKQYPGVYSRDGGTTWEFRVQFQDSGGRWGVGAGGFQTQRDARDARDTARRDAESQRGRVSRLDPSITVGAWLDRWMAAHAGTLRPSSVASYRVAVLSIQRQPGFADLQLRTVTDSDVRRLIGLLRAQGLGYETVMLRVRVLRTALGAAVKDGVLRGNPAVGIRVPRTEPKFQAQTWDAPTALAFLRNRREAGDPLYPIYRLALVTGLRRGELLGLRWFDVDLAAGVLRVSCSRGIAGGRVVEGAPKTDGSAAPVYLDRDTCTLLAAMPRISEHVATNPSNGRPWHPVQFWRAFQVACAEAKVPAVRFHDLRHTSATLLAEAGVPLSVAQDRLRHMNPAMTARYTHIQGRAAQAAADTLAAVLRDEGDGGLVAV